MAEQENKKRKIEGEGAAEIAANRNRLKENVPNMSEAKLRCILDELLQHDTVVVALSEIMPPQIEHCLICHEDFDFNANTSVECGFDHVDGKEISRGGCCSWDSMCSACIYCGSHVFCETNNKPYASYCLQGHISSMKEIPEGQRKRIESCKDWGCEDCEHHEHQSPKNDEKGEDDNN